jgi:hypothetical protein
MSGDSRYWVITNPHPGEPSLPAPGSLVLPIVDEQYGGIIGWANTEEQADRIVDALRLVDAIAAVQA